MPRGNVYKASYSALNTLIKDGNILEENLKKEKMPIDDLMLFLRAQPLTPKNIWSNYY
jgi:uncharacterized membrane protein YcaP (DUF421 family)